jgi:hypothetical protein
MKTNGRLSLLDNWRTREDRSEDSYYRRSALPATGTRKKLTQRSRQLECNPHSPSDRSSSECSEIRKTSRKPPSQRQARRSRSKEAEVVEVFNTYSDNVRTAAGPPIGARQPVLARERTSGAGDTPNGPLISKDMLPCSKWSLTEDKAVYKAGEEILFEVVRQQPAEKMWRKTISFPTKPVYVINSLTHPLNLPAPIGRNNLPKECRRAPLTMFMPKLKLCSHAGRCECMVMGQRDIFHRETVLPDSCLRSGVLSQLVFSMESTTKEPFIENPSRFYFWDKETSDFSLAIPQPFRNGASWVPKLFNPVMSDCSDKKALSLYYGLYHTGKAREIAQLYQTHPGQWSSRSHPCLGEPAEGSELWRVSKLLYGVESVPRANYAQHPLADPSLFLFMAADPSTFLVPVFPRNPEEPDMPDQIIGSLLRPFWHEAAGQVLCPVCLLEVIEDEFRPVLLTRSQFIQHWVQHHLSSFVAVCTFSATQLNGRIYQGHTIYVLARNSASHDKKPDKPESCPLDWDAVHSAGGWTTSKILAKILNISDPSFQEESKTKVQEADLLEGDEDEEMADLDGVDQDELLEEKEETSTDKEEGYKKKVLPDDEAVVKAARGEKKKKKN